jgi:hypothetical protein
MDITLCQHAKEVKSFIETIYLNDKCSGDPISKTTINTDACVRTAGGEACAWFCE